jgi:transcriptional regulator with XRE-family HTH domain
MVLLRRVIGDALRARRQGQHRTLREVSTAANVSLGYLSEIERGQKEASSELLAAICDALGTQLSEVLRQASDTMALAEQLPDVLVPVTEQPARPGEAADRAGAVQPRPVPAGERPAAVPDQPVPSGADLLPEGVGTDLRSEDVDADLVPAAGGSDLRLARAKAAKAVRTVATDGKVSVSVRQDSPLKATLRTRPLRAADRDVVCAV